MSRRPIEQRLLILRAGLLAAAHAHASEHDLSPRSAIKELKQAAGLLSVADAGDGSRPRTAHPLIPAYKTRGHDGALIIQFRCPTCHRVHSHGMPDPTDPPLLYRGSHCQLDIGEARGYRLLVVGWQHGDDLPTCTSAEIDALNAVISES